jgi:predicted nucleic acid-binding protein
MMTDCVVDASVVVSLFVADEGAVAALRLFQQLGEADAPTFYAPDALYYETVSAMRKHALKFGYARLTKSRPTMRFTWRFRKG